MRLNIPALRKALSFSCIGASPRDAAALFCIGILNQIDHSRPKARKLASKLLVIIAGSGGLIEFVVRIRGQRFPVKVRVNDLGDYQTVWECFGGMYHQPTVSIRHIFDGGGNIGLFSLAMSGLTGAKDVVAVEPDDANFVLLEENLQIFAKAVKIKAALAATNGVANFVRHASNAGYLDIEKSDGSVEVKTLRISDAFPPQWDLAATYLKLDIEGAEYEVLPDMLKSGIRPAVITAEIHDFIRMGGERLIDQLRDAGYAVEISGFGTEGYVCRQIFARLP